MLTDQLPKVSCLLVTQGRPEETHRSIRCFQNQTYPNKELIVISQGSADVNQFLFELTKPLLDVQFFCATSRLSLGAMRNLSCEIANGPILCQWDDDDLYFPTRIMDQFKALKSNSRNIASAFTAFFKYFIPTEELYWCDWRGEGVPSSQFLCGSVMFYKRIFHRYGSLLYPEVGKQSVCEEDLNVLHKLLDSGNVAATSSGHQYIYCYHGKNTYDLQHHQLTLLVNSGKKVADKEELLVNRKLIEDTLASHSLGRIQVRSLSEVAFTYDPE